VIFRLSSSVDLELQFYSFTFACFIGKLWRIGPLCSFSSLGTVSIVRCPTCHYWAFCFIPFPSTRLHVLFTLFFCVSTLVVPPKSSLQAFRLLFILTGCSAVMRVKVDFLEDSKSSAALSFVDLTSIIEEPPPFFFTPACKHKDSPLSVCWERWKHIQCFYFVYASPHQAALYSRLDVPHYSKSAVKMKSAIAKILQAHPGQDCISHYHLPHINSITPFLLVFNHLPPSVNTIFTKMNWGCIARTPYSHVEQASKESSLSTSGQPRQFMFADFGNTSGLNQSRADDPSGMPHPAILNSTSNHSWLFVQVTAIAILLAPHLGILDESVYVDPGYSERHREFQEVIHPDNRVKAIQMAMISSMLKCGCHCDLHNCSSIPGMMLVLVHSRFVSINDVPCCSSVITYSRKITTSYGRMTKTPYYQCLNDFVTYYQLSANLSRLVIGHNHFVKPTVPWKPSQT
jgi:hypothetical protein